MSRANLLIEDNEQNRYLATYLPEHEGYQLVNTFDGPRGFALAREMMPSINLPNIQLPAMDGFEVARALGMALSKNRLARKLLSRKSRILSLLQPNLKSL